jgi:hypothetical protein
MRISDNQSAYRKRMNPCIHNRNISPAQYSTKSLNRKQPLQRVQRIQADIVLSPNPKQQEQAIRDREETQAEK